MGSYLKALASLACLLLSGCLDTHEEVWVRADGSGAARVSLAVPVAASAMHGGEEGVKKLIEDFLTETPAITTHILETRVEDARLHVDLTITFDNALDLIADTSEPASGKLPAAGSELMGTAKVDFKGLDMVFTRTVEFSKAVPGAIFIPQSQLEGHAVTTILHLPEAAISHNATSTADGGRTLIWETSLAEAFRKPRVTEFTMPLPIPWGWVSFVALLLLILFAVLARYLIRMKRAKTEQRSSAAAL